MENTEHIEQHQKHRSALRALKKENYWYPIIYKGKVHMYDFM